MARPSKSVKTMSKNLTKEEIDVRTKTEEQLKGATDKISPPDHMNEKQADIFNYIVRELRASGILGNLDIYVLSTCTFAIERMFQLQSLINENPDKEDEYINKLDKYTKTFFRCCNELSLSPQSRAKLGNINYQVQVEEDDPLLKVLSGGKK